MVTLTNNANTNTRTGGSKISYHFVPKNRALISAQNSVNFDTQEFEKLMAEGYLAMADIHGKYAEITFKAISEVVP
jgi:hypothetical protein